MDLIVFRYLHSLAGKYPWMDPFIIFKAEYLGWWVLGGLGIFLVASAYFRKDITKASWMVFTALSAGILSRFIFADTIRFFYDRPRPFEVLSDVYQLVAHSGGSAFPSGHATFFFALAAGVFIFYRWWGVLFFAFAVSISAGRVIVGIHWPSDILAGAIIGIASAYLVYYILSIYQKRA